LANYVYPVIGDVPVPDVDRAMVLKIIEPLWLTKTETASRIRGRIETVLDWAEAKELRSGKNPATWRYLKKLLPEKKKLKRVRHHPALPYADVPAFIRALRHHEGQSAKALEFTALTAARTGATIGATWDEIDLEARIWIVPPERTGAKIMEEDPRPRRVPLCNRAIEILSSLPREEGNPFVFIGAKAGRSLSNMAMLELMRELRPGYVPHGLRSSFKDWCAETTDYPDEVSEEALWHVISDEVKKAYRRSDLFNRRADLMAEWAAYCDGDPPVDRAQPGRAKLRIVA
jgi:integrase